MERAHCKSEIADCAARSCPSFSRVPDLKSPQAVEGKAGRLWQRVDRKCEVSLDLADNLNSVCLAIILNAEVLSVL